MEPTDTLKHDRQTYVAMVSFADDAIRNFTEALKAKQMYERTLLIVTADNGGPVYFNGAGGANNFPCVRQRSFGFEDLTKAARRHKGGKMSNCESTKAPCPRSD